MCALFAYTVPVYAGPFGSTMQEVIVTVRPNIQEDPSNPDTNAPLSNAISHVIPVAFAVSGIVLAVTLVSAPVLAVTVLIVTALGTVALNQLLGALW